jgi:hypothetical protein
VTLDDFVPHSIITSVHEEFNDNDELKRLPLDDPPVNGVPVPLKDKTARDDLVVYVAPGGHLLSLRRQPDVIDWEDVLTDFPGSCLVDLVHPDRRGVVLILSSCRDRRHFVDAEDETTGRAPSPGGAASPAGDTNSPTRSS